MSSQHSTPVAAPVSRADARQCRAIAERLAACMTVADLEATADHLLTLARERRDRMCHVCGLPAQRLVPWSDAVSCHADHTALEVAP